MRYKDCEGDIRDLVNAQIDEVEQAERVRIVRVVESGSHGWGFASPDSDYDVRFVYGRRLEDCLSLEPKRKDTIEWRLDEMLDVSGWDLSKYLQLAHTGTIYVFEWGGNPCVYRSTPEWEGVWEAVRPYYFRKAAMHSYRGIAKSTYEEFLLPDRERVRYKKYLYALRPLLACKLIAECSSCPPVRFSELVEKVAESSLVPAIDLLLERKAAMTEKDKGPRIPEVDAFIEDALSRYGELAASMEDDRREEWGPLNEAFLEALEVSEK